MVNKAESYQEILLSLI